MKKKENGNRLFALFCLFTLLVAYVPFAHAEEAVFTYRTDETGDAVITKITAVSGVCRIPEKTDGHTVTAVSAYACNGNAGLTELIFPDSVQRIEAGAFEDCTALSKVTLPSSLTFLGASAFGGTALTSVVIPQTLTECETDGGFLYVFAGKTRTLTNGPFARCESLRSASFEDGIVYIPDGLFAGCTGLETIVYPDSAVYIGENACKDCLRLTAVTFGDAVGEIRASAFADCVSLADVSLPSSLVFLGGGAFSETAIKEITVPKALQTCETGDLSFYSINEKKYTVYAGPFGLCDCLQTVRFEKGIATIPDYLFAGCTGLETVTLPETVVSVGNGAFLTCLRLHDIGFGGTETCIGEYAFRYCVSLTDISVPDSVTILGDGCFADCTVLTDVHLPAQLQKVRPALFRNCTFLRSVTIPDTVSAIGAYAFKNCTALFAVGIPDKCTSVGAECFAGCEKLESVVFPDAVAEIGKSVCQGCSALNRVQLGTGISVIPESAFRDCKKLSEAVLSDSLQTVGKQAFLNDISLQTVTIPSAVTQIDKTAFAYSGLETVCGVTGSVAQTFATENGFYFTDTATGTHTHDFSAKRTEEQYLVREADCTNPAVYAYACTVCGAVGKNTFPVGSALSHTDENRDGICDRCKTVLLMPTDAVITVGNADAVADGIVSIPVYVKNNHGFSYLKLTVSYDGFNLTLLGIKNGTVSVDGFTVAGKRAVWDSVYDSDKDGLLAVLQFRVSENAETQDYTVSVRTDGCFDADENGVYFATGDGHVAVRDFLYGDVNADGTVDGKDLIRLRRYLADLDFETGLSSVTVSPGADCNADGKTDIKDVVLLRQYLANTDDDTAISTVKLGK